MSDVEHPWFAELLGKRPARPLFERAGAEFSLETEQEPDDKHGWYESRASGVSVHFTDGVVSSILMFPASDPDFDEFVAELPAGLRFEMTIDDVTTVLGPPFSVAGNSESMDVGSAMTSRSSSNPPSTDMSWRHRPRDPRDHQPHPPEPARIISLS